MWWGGVDGSYVPNQCSAGKPVINSILQSGSIISQDAAGCEVSLEASSDLEIEDAESIFIALF